MAISKDALKALNDLAVANGLPSYTDLVNSLCDVLDGTKHAADLVDDTGLKISDAQKILDIRDAVKTHLAGPDGQCVQR